MKRSFRKMRSQAGAWERGSKCSSSLALRVSMAETFQRLRPTGFYLWAFSRAGGKAPWMPPVRVVPTISVVSVLPVIAACSTADGGKSRPTDGFRPARRPEGRYPFWQRCRAFVGRRCRPSGGPVCLFGFPGVSHYACAGDAGLLRPSPRAPRPSGWKPTP
jgi:hypothetical protein